MDTLLQRPPTSAYAGDSITVSKCDVIRDYVKSVIDRRGKGNIKVTSRSAKPLFLLLRTDIVGVVGKWFLFCVLVSSVCGEQRFAIEPQDQTAVVGSRVTLPCRVEDKVGQLQWTKDDFGLGTHRHLTGYERYKMIGSDEEGDYSLDIRDVTLDDDAMYQCQVSSGPIGQPPIRSRYARLQILVPPEPPRILQGPTLQTVEDREVSLECVSIGGKPAAEITWVDSDGGVLSQGVSFTVEPMTDGQRFTARSVLRLHPSRYHHNQTFTCQAQNTADRTYRSTYIKLQVNYAPKVRVFIKSGATNGRIQEGDTVTMGCQATANPNNITFKWYVDGDLIPGDIRNELVLHNVSRAYNEATVKCEVHNIVGRSADTKTLQISYGPSFRVKPQNLEGEMGSTVTLKCMVDGHPQPKMLWLRYEKDRVIRVGTSTTLNVTVTEHSSGQYWCRGSVQGYSDVEAVATIFVKGPPKLLTNQTQYGTEGDIVRIECVSLSIPKPEYIIWSFGGNEINSFQDHEYAFLEEALPDRTTKSTLIIRRSGPKHFGAYNCTVINAFGAGSVVINLVKDDTFPLIFIISGCSSAVIIILIVMLIMMLCHRKRNTKETEKKSDSEFEKKEKLKDSDRSSNISDLKLELRQVEGSCDVDNMGSETDLHPKLHLTSNLGLPLAGPVTLPDAGYDNEIMKHYQRYSGDFSQPISDLHLKPHTTTNGYIPYVDYAKDYAPPSESLTGSLSRSIDSSVFINQNLLPRQASCGRLGMVGPDLIPNAGVFTEADARYAATYANPYLGGPTSYGSQVNTNPSAKPPPPYYTLRNSNFSPPAVNSPSSSCSSQRVTSSLASSSPSSTAQPQVPKHSPQSSGSLYVLPASHGTPSSKHITTKGKGTKLKGGTHV